MSSGFDSLPDGVVEQQQMYGMFWQKYHQEQSVYVFVEMTGEDPTV